MYEANEWMTGYTSIPQGFGGSLAPDCFGGVVQPDYTDK